ncbi:MAG: GDSL-type esterase/lipase family protein [Planctomycetaceae bacterium]|nr:GDSL-type esterase/lipase family protein [Planctomycetaceae bacterium]
MDEPTWLLRGASYHFVSGQALWFGLALLLLAVRAEEWEWKSGTVLLFALLGLTWIALSGWPSFWLQGLLFVAACSWLIRPALPMQSAVPSSAWLGQAVIAVAAIAVLLETSWLLGPWKKPGPIAELAVIGDSVTAGLNDGDAIWPRVLAESGSCSVWDASQQGATVESASRQLARLQGRGDALLIEIGGNDLLEGLPLRKFAERLETLLKSARPQYRTIVMLELPLPPLSNRYGVIQRRLARRYGVPLIPKREFARVLTMSGATVDGIHLSDRGQQRMADVVRAWLRLQGTAAEYHRVNVR